MKPSRGGRARSQQAGIIVFCHDFDLLLLQNEHKLQSLMYLNSCGRDLIESMTVSNVTTGVSDRGRGVRRTTATLTDSPACTNRSGRRRLPDSRRSCSTARTRPLSPATSARHSEGGVNNRHQTSAASTVLNHVHYNGANSFWDHPAPLVCLSLSSFHPRLVEAEGHSL